METTATVTIVTAASPPPIIALILPLSPRKKVVVTIVGVAVGVLVVEAIIGRVAVLNDH